MGKMTTLKQMKPLCEGLSRPETTALLGDMLVQKRLNRRNAYSYWAHEVIVSRHLYGESDMRIDFMQFEPRGYHACTDVAAIEGGTFTCYEVKSCIADLKSGHGLNFIGDVNWLVMPVEMYEPYKEMLAGDGKFSQRMWGVGCLLFGKLNGRWPAFQEVPPTFTNLNMRTRAASELLLCMMRALLANSDHSRVNHEICQKPSSRRDADVSQEKEGTR